MRVITTAAVLCLAVARCGGGGREGERSPSNARSSNPDTHEDNFRIGRTVGKDGVVTNETSKFAAGDAIYVSFVVRNAPPGSSAKVIWRRMDGDRVMADDEKPLSSDGLVSFVLKDTSSWPPGSYRLVKMVGGGASDKTPAAWRTIGTMDVTISPR